MDNYVTEYNPTWIAMVFYALMLAITIAKGPRRKANVRPSFGVNYVHQTLLPRMTHKTISSGPANILLWLKPGRTLINSLVPFLWSLASTGEYCLFCFNSWPSKMGIEFFPLATGILSGLHNWTLWSDPMTQWASAKRKSHRFEQALCYQDWRHLGGQTASALVSTCPDLSSTAYSNDDVVSPAYPLRYHLQSSMPSGSAMSLVSLRPGRHSPIPLTYSYRLQEIHVPEKGGSLHGLTSGSSYPLLKDPTDSSLANGSPVGEWA